VPLRLSGESSFVFSVCLRLCGSKLDRSADKPAQTGRSSPSDMSEALPPAAVVSIESVRSVAKRYR